MKEATGDKPRISHQNDDLRTDCWFRSDFCRFVSRGYQVREKKKIYKAINWNWFIFFFGHNNSKFVIFDCLQTPVPNNKLWIMELVFRLYLQAPNSNGIFDQLKVIGTNWPTDWHFSKSVCLTNWWNSTDLKIRWFFAFFSSQINDELQKIVEFEIFKLIKKKKKISPI